MLINKRSLLQIIPAALLLSLISTVLAFSFAAMMTQTNQAVLLPDMVVAMLLTAMISALLVAWKGSIAGLIGIPLPSAAAMFADLLQGVDPSVEQFWLLLMLNGLMTAGFMLLMGSLKLSRIVRYLPLPVLAGFLAGIGWLFIKGGLGLTGFDSLAINQLQDTALWMAIIFSFTLWFLRERVQPAHLLPIATLVGGVIMVTLAPMLQNQSAWFFQLEASGSLPVTGYQWIKSGVPKVDWVLLPWGALLTLASISVLSMLLQATSIELLAKKDLNLDQELRLAGGMNLLTALTGGGIASLSLSQTSMARQMQANYRLTGILIALLLLVVIFIHEHLLRWLPLPLVAGLLIFQGMQFINQWLITSGQRFPRADQTVIAVIFVVIVFQGFLGGVLLGLLLTVLLFIREYSRLQVIQLNTNLIGLTSGVERTSQEQDWLELQANRVRVYRLRGFLFFGTANTLIEQIKKDVKDKNASIEAFLLDFSQVSNADSSTANSLLRLKQFCDEQKIGIFITGLKQVIQQRLQATGMVFNQPLQAGSLRLTDTLEEALETLENKLLEEADLDEQSPVKMMLQHRLTLEDKDVHKLLAYFKEEHFVDGEWVIQEGQKEQVLYIIASGSIEVGFEDPASAQWVRIKKMRPGTLLGEMGLYLNEPRSASARAVGTTSALSLTHVSLSQMEARNPELALVFHRFVVLMQSERLRESNQRIYSLLQD